MRLKSLEGKRKTGGSFIYFCHTLQFNSPSCDRFGRHGFCVLAKTLTWRVALTQLTYKKINKNI